MSINADGELRCSFLVSIAQLVSPLCRPKSAKSSSGYWVFNIYSNGAAVLEILSWFRACCSEGNYFALLKNHESLSRLRLLLSFVHDLKPCGSTKNWKWKVEDWSSRKTFLKNSFFTWVKSKSMTHIIPLAFPSLAFVTCIQISHVVFFFFFL